MTRLVRVRAICDECSAAAATRFCVSLRSVLCEMCSCIRRRSRHPYVTLASTITGLAFCEYCDNSPATTYCETEGVTLCDKCNETVHKSCPLPHCRSPIQNTLRTRAIQFRHSSRSRARKRLTRPKINQSPNEKRATGTYSCMDSKEKRITTQPFYPHSSTASKPNATSKLSKQRPQPGRNVQNNPPQQSVPSPVQKKPITKTSSALVTHKHRSTTLSTRSQSSAAPTEKQQPIRVLKPPAGPPRNDLFRTDDYSSLLDSQPTHSSPHISIDTLPFSSLPTEIADAAKSLCEPLLITEEPHIQPLESDPLAEPESCTLDLSNALSSASLGLSTDDNLDHVNMRPPPPSPYMPHDSLPASNAIPSDVRRSQSPAQCSITVAVAAAATAAGEMYLLNTAPPISPCRAEVPASLGNGSSVVDPGGVAAAATAAAAVEMSSLSSQAIDSKVQQSVALPKHVSEPFLPLRAAAQQHVFDEAMRRLDVDLIKHRIKDEIHVVHGQHQIGRSEGPNNVLASVYEYTNCELGRRLAVDDIEVQEEELMTFGSQFDQTLPSSQAFESGGAFSPHHRADWGN